MPEPRSIEERLRTVETTLSNVDVGNLDGTSEHSRIGDLASAVSDLEERIGELEAGLQAVRGYVGNIDHVNETVERRANAALAAVERLETAPSTPPRLATAQRPHSLDSAQPPTPHDPSEPNPSAPSEQQSTGNQHASQRDRESPTDSTGSPGGGVSPTDRDVEAAGEPTSTIDRIKDLL
ncbi:MAG: hypothetical protein ABEJ58_08060 [Halodesulfurarchaeum sp.]